MILCNQILGFWSKFSDSLLYYCILCTLCYLFYGVNHMAKTICICALQKKSHFKICFWEGVLQDYMGIFLLSYKSISLSGHWWWVRKSGVQLQLHINPGKLCFYEADIVHRAISCGNMSGRLSSSEGKS